MSEQPFILYADGGARGNPGPAGAGVCLFDSEGKTVASLGKYLGETTNNVAEYSALLLGLGYAIKNGIRRLRICMDSQLVVRQIEGLYRVKEPHLRRLYEEALDLLKKLELYQIEHIPRAQNHEADRLANLAIDRRSSF